MQTRVVRRLHATSKGSLHHRIYAAAPAVHSCIAALSPPTTLMTATCIRCRHPRTPSCPTNMHHSITQTLPRAGSLVAAVRISPPLCDGQVPGTRCAPSQQADAPKCARLVLVTCILLGTLVSRYSNEALLTALCFSTAPGLDAAGAPAAFAS
jgi:hypothetical protein